MWSHEQIIQFGAIFIFGSLIALLGSANSKSPWHVRYVAFAIGVTSFILGVLIPVSLWNR